MMRAWEFAVRDAEEAGRLVRALGKHRYVKEVDHRLHYLVDAALVDRPAFKAKSDAFADLCAESPDIELGSRDPRLWRSATADEVAEALAAFWSPDDDGPGERLRELFAHAGLTPPQAAPFEADPEEPQHPELILLDWVLHPVDALDAERHEGVLNALEESEEMYHPSEPIYQEGPSLGLRELCDGAEEGELVADFLIWSDGPYAYANYVFRGASRAAKLAEPPIGLADFDAP